MSIVDFSLPTGPQVGTKYILTGPDGTTVSFNDPSDENYIGMLTDVSGLDSPDVRESADDLVQFDGGIHGDFFFGRRPITMSGILLNPIDVVERNYRMTKLQRASRAMTGDAILSWLVSGGSDDNWQQVRVRRQQPLRITGGWQKDFQLALVAEDPRIYGVEEKSAYNTVMGSFGGFEFPLRFPFDFDVEDPGVVPVENFGNAPMWPIFRVTGTFSGGLTITNLDTGQAISMPTYAQSIARPEVVTTIDTLNRIVTGWDVTGEVSVYSYVSFTNTDWFPLYPGLNRIDFSVGSYTTTPELTVTWRDAWM